MPASRPMHHSRAPSAALQRTSVHSSLNVMDPPSGAYSQSGHFCTSSAVFRSSRPTLLRLWNARRSVTVPLAALPPPPLSSSAASWQAMPQRRGPALGVPVPAAGLAAAAAWGGGFTAAELAAAVAPSCHCTSRCPSAYWVGGVPVVPLPQTNSWRKQRWSPPSNDASGPDGLHLPQVAPPLGSRLLKSAQLSIDMLLTAPIRDCRCGSMASPSGVTMTNLRCSLNEVASAAEYSWADVSAQGGWGKVGGGRCRLSSLAQHWQRSTGAVQLMQDPLAMQEPLARHASGAWGWAACMRRGLPKLLPRTAGLAPHAPLNAWWMLLCQSGLYTIGMVQDEKKGWAR